MKISYEDMNRIKTLNLPRLMTDYGVRLSQNHNGSYSFFCPFHEDKNPSLKVNLKGNKWLWHCFGCNLGGNVINFVARYEKISTHQAIAKLIPKPASRKPYPNTEPQSQSILPKAQKLLNKAVQFYHATFYEDKKALNYLSKARKLHESSIFEAFKIGYANSTLYKAIPRKGELVELLKETGILNKSGKEHFQECVVFPVFDDNGNVVEIYGRRLIDREPKHLYLKGAHKGVFNHHAAKTNNSIILTEGIIDSLSIYQAGFRNVIPLYGTNGLTQDHINLLRKENVKEIYLCMDQDKAGRRAQEELKKILTGFALTTYIIQLPEGMDPNQYFKESSSSDFEALLNKANSGTAQKKEPVLKETKEHIKPLKDGLFIEYSERKYLIRGIDASCHQRLRVNIKAQGEGRFHIDTIDLYVSKQRKAFVREAALLFREEPSIIEEDLNRIIEKIEEYAEGKKDITSIPYVMPDKEKEDALRFLKSPRLIDLILHDFEVIGCTGETTNKLMGYLASVSRKLDDPLSLIILSRSAAGKSLLQDSILELVPGEDKAKYTRITGQALFYKGEDSLKHKLIAIEEEEGANEASYSIRTIQSSKVLTIATTIKDPLTGSMKTQEYQVKGPLSIILTTTRTDIDYETINRFIVLTIDETRAQTQLIHRIQREKDTLRGLLMDHEKEAVIRRHHNSQRLLRPLKVVNPYAHLLTFSDERLRARRDHKKYLNLIKAITFLFQYQRRIKQIEQKDGVIEYIEVTLEDITLANRVAHEVLGRSLDELSPPSRRLLFLIKEMINGIAKREDREPKEIRFTRRNIREYTKWSDHQVRDNLRQLVDLEYVLIANGRNGLRFIYELVYEGGGEDGAHFFMGLADIEELKKKARLAPRKADLAPSLRPACGHLAVKV